MVNDEWPGRESWKTRLCKHTGFWMPSVYAYFGERIGRRFQLSVYGATKSGASMLLRLLATPTTEGHRLELRRSVGSKATCRSLRRALVKAER
jgi:hypothetical protein